jgi:hypothetical protein
VQNQVRKRGHGGREPCVKKAETGAPAWQRIRDPFEGIACQKWAESRCEALPRASSIFVVRRVDLSVRAGRHAATNAAAGASLARADVRDSPVVVFVETVRVPGLPGGFLASLHGQRGTVSRTSNRTSTQEHVIRITRIGCKRINLF